MSRRSAADKLADRLSAAFVEQLDADFAVAFPGVTIETTWSLFAATAGALVSRREDGRVLTVGQKRWIDAYSAGYTAAVTVLQRPEGDR